MAKLIRKQDVQPIEPGLHHGVIPALIDMGVQKPHPASENQDSRWQYAVAIEFPAELATDNKPRTTWITVNESLNPKSTMGKIVAAAGITPGDEFDPAQLVDANLTVLVEHVQKEGKTYANVVGFAPLGKGVQKVKAVRRDAQPPQWIQRKIANRLDQVSEPFTGEAATKPNNEPKW